MADTEPDNMKIKFNGRTISCQIDFDMDVFTDNPIDESSEFVEPVDDFCKEELGEIGFYATPIKHLLEKYGSISITSLEPRIIELNNHKNE